MAHTQTSMTDKGVVDMSMGEVPLHKRNFEKEAQRAVQIAQTIEGMCLTFNVSVWAAERFVMT